jgi:PAS domain S-box-containing protein
MPEEELPSARSIRENRVIMDAEVGVVREDGSVSWVTVNAAPLPGVGAVVATMDLTKRKLAEKALAASEDRYRRLFNEMTEGFALHEIICDATGKPSDYRFLEINPAFERLTGLKREKILGRRLTEILPEEDPKWLERYGHVALTGEPVHFENFSPALNRYYEVDAYCPAPGQFAVMFLDITARKRVEHLLQEQYVELENLYHSLPIGLGVIDRQFRYLRINDRLAAINGLSGTRIPTGFRYRRNRRQY